MINVKEEKIMKTDIKRALANIIKKNIIISYEK
jgi:hypothetical protein